MEPDPWGSRPPQQSYGQAGVRPAAPIRLPARGRPVLIALVAVLVEVVLVAAFGNQAVTKEVVKGYNRTSNGTLRDLLASGLTYNWRFSTGGLLSTQRHLASQLVLLAALFVLTFLLVLAVVRGAITFGRAFFGAWMAVVVATQLGSVASNSIYDPTRPGAPRSFDRGVWGLGSASAFTFVAGLGLGLVTALITALVAVASRRSGEMVTPAEPEGYLPPPPPEPAAPPPFSPDAPTLRKEPPRSDDRTQVISRDSGSAWPSAAAAGIGAGAGAAAASRDSDTTSETSRVDEPTQAHPTVDEPTQAHPVTPVDEPTQAHPVAPADEPSTPDEPPAQHDIPPNATVQLPRFEPGKEPWRAPDAPGGEPAVTDRGADTNELPTVDPGPRFPGSDPNAPQQTHFPRPPNDEDLGHDHHDD